MKNCPKCKTEYPDDKMFCKICGVKLISAKETDPKFTAKKMVLEERIKIDPLNISLLNELAELLIENNLYDEAILILYKILAIEDNNLKAQRYLFHCLNAKGKTKEAAEIGYKLVDLFPDNSDLILEVALLAMGEEDHNRALDYFDRIIKIDPNKKNIWKYKATLLSKIGNKSSALDTWNTVYKIDSHDTEAKLYLGVEAAKNGEYSKAKELIESVVKESKEITQNQFVGLVYLAKSFLNLNLDADSIADLYTKIFEVNQPEWLNDDLKVVLVDIAFALGQKALDKDDYNTALTFYGNVEELGNINKCKIGRALTYYKMSEEYFNKSDFPNAEYYINESLKYDPTNPEVKEKHSEILKNNNVGKRKKKKITIILSSVVLIIILVAIFIIKSIQSQNEKKVWEIAKQENTFQSYVDYLLVYPNGNYVQEANANKEKVSFFVDKRDGKKYKIVLIGKQIWMAENLNYETNTGSWLYKNGNDDGEKYGRLYNWETAALVSPQGWRLPTKEDFDTLSASVSNNGNALKAIGQGTADGAGSNTSGFSALLAGNYKDDGYLNSLGYSADFWSSTGDTRFYYCLNLYSYNNSISLFNCNKKYGFSVRCIKDNNNLNNPSLYHAENNSIGEWKGNFGEKQIIIVIEQINNDHATGYNLLNGKKRPISGQIATIGNSLKFELKEPGDDKWDGVFNFFISNGKLEGTWKSNNGKLTRSFILTKEANSNEENLPTLLNDVNLVAYYKLEDIIDSKGSYKLTNLNSVAFNVAKFGNGADFGSSNTRKGLTNSSSLGLTNTSNYSISIWVKLSTEISSGLYNIVTINFPESRYMSFYYRYNFGTRRLVHTWGAGNDAIYNISLGTSKWYHLVAVKNGSSLSIYVNGSLVSNSGNLGSLGGGGNGFTEIGENSSTNYTSGIFDDFAVFSRALSATEISNYYNAAIKR